MGEETGTRWSNRVELDVTEGMGWGLDTAVKV